MLKLTLKYLINTFEALGKHSKNSTNFVIFRCFIPLEKYVLKYFETSREKRIFFPTSTMKFVQAIYSDVKISECSLVQSILINYNIQRSSSIGILFVCSYDFSLCIVMSMVFDMIHKIVNLSIVFMNEFVVMLDMCL